MKKRKKPSGKAPKVIDEASALKGFIDLHPDFTKGWKKAQDMYREDAPLMVYGRFVYCMMDMIARDSHAEIGPIMDYVETLMRDGSEDVKGIISVFFVESLLNITSHGPRETAPIIKKMGPLTRKFALEYGEEIVKSAESIKQ